MCDLLDFRCIIMNELFGSVLLTLFAVAIIYFIVASKLRLGFDTTMAFAIPFMLIGGLIIGGFQALFAFLTVVVGVMVAWIFQNIIGNR